MKKALTIVFLLGLIGAFLLASSGDALTLMTPAQKSTLETLRRFKSDTDKSEISNVFGNPVKSSLGETSISWEIDQDGNITRVKAYFITGELNKIHFISLDPFWGYTLYYSLDGVSHET